MADSAGEDVAALWAENVEGHTVGSGVSIIREHAAEVGSGPRLHRHPYPETFVVLRGHARFTIGDTQRDGGPGDVLVVAAGVAHTFRVLGPGVYEAVHIHENDRFVTEWLESPGRSGGRVPARTRAGRYGRLDP